MQKKKRGYVITDLIDNECGDSVVGIALEKLAADVSVIAAALSTATDRYTAQTLLEIADRWRRFRD